MLALSYCPSSVARWSGRKRQSVGASLPSSPGVSSFSFMQKPVRLYLQGHRGQQLQLHQGRMRCAGRGSVLGAVQRQVRLCVWLPPVLNLRFR